MDAKLKRYYRKKMSGGRSLIARVADFIMLRIVILSVIFVIMLQWSRSLVVSVTVAALITAAVSLLIYTFRMKKTEKFFEKDLQRIREKCMLETLTLMNEHEFVEYMACLFPGLKSVHPVPGGFLADYKGLCMAVLHNHPRSECGVSEIVGAYRLCKDETRIAVVSLSDFADDAKRLAESASITLINGSEVLRIAGEKEMMPDEVSAEKRAKHEMEEAAVSMERVRRFAFSRAKVKAYILCGLVTLIWPFFGVWRIYYPIISVLCFIFAFVSYRRGKHTQESVGIDVT